MALPSVLPTVHLQEAPRGLHRFEPVCWTESLPPGAMLLTRQGISLCLLPGRPPKRTTAGRSFLPTSSRRREVRTVSSTRSARVLGVQSLRGQAAEAADFPADCLHRTDFHCRDANAATSTAGYSDVPAYSRGLHDPCGSRGQRVVTLGPL